ncbi:MAG: hypothetical protein V1494_03775 [Candidatus Diapherotrites archaeon]
MRQKRLLFSWTPRKNHFRKEFDLKKAVADTSALISLSFSGRLNLVAQTIQIMAPEQVKCELEEIAGFEDEKANAAKEVLSLIKKKDILVHPVLDRKKAEALVNKNTDYGEAECFELAVEQKINALIMDDLNASYMLAGIAKAQEISIKISAAAIVELANQGKLSKKEAKESLLKMVKHRKWEKTTLEYLIEKYLP